MLTCKWPIVVAVRDTDVLLLLLAHYDRTGRTRLYMKARALNAPKYFQVHEIRMLLSIDLADTLHLHSMPQLDVIMCLSSVAMATKKNSLDGIQATSH